MKKKSRMFFVLCIALLMLFAYSSVPSYASENDNDHTSSLEDAKIIDRDINSETNSSFDEYSIQTPTEVQIENILPSLEESPGYFKEPSIPYNPVPNSSFVPENEGIGTMATPDVNYPNSQIVMRPGDVLISSKTLSSSTKIVGHAAIVSADRKIIHVTAPVNGGVKESLTTFMKRHEKKGITITVLRSKHGKDGAVRLAEEMYPKVTQYLIDLTTPLNEFNPNYCSKFIWQVYFYGQPINGVATDYTGNNYQYAMTEFIFPSMLNNTEFFYRLGTFKTVW